MSLYLPTRRRSRERRPFAIAVGALAAAAAAAVLACSEQAPTPVTGPHAVPRAPSFAFSYLPPEDQFPASQPVKCNTQHQAWERGFHARLVGETNVGYITAPDGEYCDVLGSAPDPLVINLSYSFGKAAHDDNEHYVYVTKLFNDGSNENVRVTTDEADSNVQAYKDDAAVHGLAIKIPQDGNIERVIISVTHYPLPSTSTG